jgi:hypothetical protein
MQYLQSKMKLNGNSFPIYVIDTVKSIEERIAASLNSTVRWLIFDKRPTSVFEYENADIRVRDYLAEISSLNTLSVPTGPYPALISAAQVQDVFIATNAAILNADVTYRNILLSTIKNTHRDADAIFKDRVAIMAKILKEISETKAKAIDYETRAKTFFEHVNPVPFTPYELDHIQFTLEFSQDVSSLTSLFNKLRLTNHVPYAALGADKRSLFKIYRNFETNPEWLEIQLDNVLLLKVDSEQNDLRPLTAKYKRYTNAAFTIIDGKLVVTMDTHVGPRYVDKQEFIQRVLTAFTSTFNLTIATERDNLVIVYYTIPKQCIDASIYAELTMNNETFNSIIAIDESIKASKIKSNVYVHILNSPDTINLNMKHTTKYNQYGMTNIGEPYIRCRIKTFSTRNIVRFQTIIGKLFTLYNNLRDDVIDFYSSYIENFNELLVKCEPVTIAPVGLRAIAPELFYPTYSRKCAHQPIIVDDASVDPTRQIMKFPTKGETITRAYACPTSQHPYIGLRINTLENKDVFPYIPCCFAKDQMKRVGSIYRKYFFEETTNVGRKQKPLEIFASRRILPANAIGILPDDILRMFDVIDPNSRSSYARKGVRRTPQSSLEAVLLGKGRIQYDTMSMDDIASIVNAQWKTLMTEKYAMAAKQELYDQNIASIIQSIQRDDLRATRFARVLETALDCNIFVFEASSDNLGGELTIPRHVKSYYKFKPNRETFFLFQHYGTEGKEEYPHVELIFRQRKDALSLGFLPGDPVVTGVFKIFRRISRSYVNGIKTTTPQIRKIPIHSQAVDFYGKCRVLNIHDENDVLTIITDPLPPFAAIAAKRTWRVTSSIVERFAARWGAKILWQRVIDGQVKEVGIYIGVNGVVLTTGTDTLNAPIKYDEQEYRTLGQDFTENLISEYNRSKRTAMLVLEYTLWFLSRYLVGKRLDRDTIDQLLIDFVRDRILIDDKHRYNLEQVVESFDGSSTTFIKNDRIIVPSPETVKRLMYACRLYALNHPQDLVNYASKIVIPRYFESTSDFTDSPSNYILDGVDAVHNLIKTYGISAKLVKSINPTATKAYHFKNETLDLATGLDAIYLAQPAESLIAANTIVETWLNTGYNELTSTPNVNLSVAVYAYTNEFSVMLIYDSPITSALILVYKLDGIAHYVALMRID